MEDMLTNIFSSRRLSAHRLTCVRQMAPNGWHMRSKRALSCISLTHTAPSRNVCTRPRIMTPKHCAVCLRVGASVCVLALVDKEQAIVKIILTTPLLSIINVYCPTGGCTNDLLPRYWLCTFYRQLILFYSLFTYNSVSCMVCII